MKTICYVAAKSGGHIIPCLTLAQEAKKRDPSLQILLMCGTSRLDADLSSNSVVDFQLNISLKPWQPKKIWQLPSFSFSLLFAFTKAFKILRKHRPITVVTTGGLIALPVSFAAYLLQIPIRLYELNATPGKAIRLLAPLASEIVVCFSEAQQFFLSSRCRLESYPIRSELKKEYNQSEAREKLNLNSAKKTIFILGGSQGSLFLNNLWKQWLMRYPLDHKKIQIIHHVGLQDKDYWKKWYKSLDIPHHLFNFTNDMGTCYRAADIVVCRSGAGTLFELEACEVPYITIPLAKRATPHQLDNALAIARHSDLITVFPQELLEKDSLLFDKALQKVIEKKIG